MTQADATRIADLDAELKIRDEKIRMLQSELGEARDMVDRLREQVEDAHQMVEQWISVFDMTQDDAGIWQFDRRQTDLWNKYEALLDRHSKLVRQWNKYTTAFNAKVAPQNIGRPLGASDAQQAEVLKLRKAGKSLRAISQSTGLGFRTVRTIVAKEAGTDRTTKRYQELRRMEFDRQRAAAFRARKKAMETIPKAVAASQKQATKLVKEAKGLGRAK